METDTQDRLVDPDEAARYLCLRRATLDVWRSTGKGPGYIKMTQSQSGRIRYRLSELDRWIREHSVEAGGKAGAQAVQE